MFFVLFFWYTRTSFSVEVKVIFMFNTVKVASFRFSTVVIQSAYTYNVRIYILLSVLQLLILNPSIKKETDIVGTSLTQLLKDPYVLIAAGMYKNHCDDVIP